MHINELLVIGGDGIVGIIKFDGVRYSRKYVFEGSVYGFIADKFIRNLL
jgi:hypothetical protein